MGKKKGVCMAKARILTMSMIIFIFFAMLVAPLVLFKVAPKDENGELLPMNSTSPAASTEDLSTHEETMVSGVVLEKYISEDTHYLRVQSPVSQGSEVTDVVVDAELYELVKEGIQIDVIPQLEN